MFWTSRSSTPVALRHTLRARQVGIVLTGEGICTVSANVRQGYVEQAVYRPLTHCIDPGELDGPALGRLLRRELHPRSDSGRRPTILTLPAGLGLTRVIEAPTREAALEQVRGESHRPHCHAVWPLAREGAFVAHSIDKAFVSAAVAAVDAAGFSCDAILPQPIAVWKSRLLVGQSETAVLDWSPEGCTLVTGTPRAIGVARQLPGCNLLNALENITGERISIDQVAAYLRILSLANPTDQEAAEGQRRRGVEGIRAQLAPFVRRVASEVGQTLRYAGRFGRLDAERLVVTGIGGLLLTPEFEQLAGLSTIPVGNLESFLPRRRVSTPLQSRPALFQLATALALFGSGADRKEKEQAA